jgi:hypothetical protein
MTARKRFMIKSTQQRVDILDAIAESKQQDRNSVINELMLDWILLNLDDPDHVEPIKLIFKNKKETNNEKI